jgi:hypothetical protein
VGRRVTRFLNIDDETARPFAQNRSVQFLRRLFRRDPVDDQWFEFWTEDDGERFAPDLWTHIEPHVLGASVRGGFRPSETPE